MNVIKILLCIFAISFYACTEIENPLEKRITKQLEGKWYFEGDPSAGYEFFVDSILQFNFWEDEDQESGVWQLKEEEIYFTGKEATWSETFQMAGKDTLVLGRNIFTKELAKTPTQILTEKLIGYWITNNNGEAEDLNLYKDGSYTRTSKGAKKVGKWEIVKDSLVFNGNYDNPVPLVINGDLMNWGSKLYERQPEKEESDNPFELELPGQWQTSKEAVNIQFVFFENGTYSNSYNYQTKNGRWTLDSNLLIMDGYKKYAEEISFDGNQLNWAGDIYDKVE